MEKGAVLIYVLLIAGIVISIAFVLTSIFATKVRLAFDFPNSVTALYAADSALEWRLYNERQDPDAAQPFLTNGASFTITTPFGEFPIKAIGTFRGVSRALEVSF